MIVFRYGSNRSVEKMAKALQQAFTKAGGSVVVDAIHGKLGKAPVCSRARSVACVWCCRLTGIPVGQCRRLLVRRT